MDVLGARPPLAADEPLEPAALTAGDTAGDMAGDMAGDTAAPGAPAWVETDVPFPVTFAPARLPAVAALVRMAMFDPVVPAIAAAAERPALIDCAWAGAPVPAVAVPLCCALDVVDAGTVP
jgi:hypothetical protein